MENEKHISFGTFSWKYRWQYTINYRISMCRSWKDLPSVGRMWCYVIVIKTSFMNIAFLLLAIYVYTFVYIINIQIATKMSSLIINRVTPGAFWTNHLYNLGIMRPYFKPQNFYLCADNIWTKSYPNCMICYQNVTKECPLHRVLKFL